MKLDVKTFRYLQPDDFRVLTATEMGSRNHEIVPTPLIISIAKIKNSSSSSGSVHRILRDLCQRRLLSRINNSKYDGYRLAYGGYDYLALNAFSRRGVLLGIGQQIGVGKESDIYMVFGKLPEDSESLDNDEQQQQRFEVESSKHSGFSDASQPDDDEGTSTMVLKIHRLGRTSFRTVKANREYLQNRKTSSWLYMSRLAAAKEFAFMKALFESGFPVPRPIDLNRHCIIMELVDGIPLYQLEALRNPHILYRKLIGLIVRLAQCGLIHGDFNEFNIMITGVKFVSEEAEEEEEQIKLKEGSHQTVGKEDSHEDEEDDDDNIKPIIIDFPQMVSTSHPNAEFYFNRDVECIKRFFRKRFGYVAPEREDEISCSSKLSSIEKEVVALDKLVEASGFTKQMKSEMDDIMSETMKDLEISSGEEEEDSEEETLRDDHLETDLKDESNDLVPSLDRESPSDNESEEEQSVDLERLNNRQYLPQWKSEEKNSNARSSVVLSEEIKKRAVAAAKKALNKGSASSSSGNAMKGRARRANKEIAKSYSNGKSFF